MYITSGHWILYSPHATVTGLLIKLRCPVYVCVSVPALSVDVEGDWGLSPERGISSAHHPSHEWGNGNPDAAQTDAGHTTVGSSVGTHAHENIFTNYITASFSHFLSFWFSPSFLFFQLFSFLVGLVAGSRRSSTSGCCCITESWQYFILFNSLRFGFYKHKIKHCTWIESTTHCFISVRDFKG